MSDVSRILFHVSDNAECENQGTIIWNLDHLGLACSSFHYTNVTTKRELVHLALQEFIKNHQRKDLRKLPGKIKICADYDYKASRRIK